jgi:preprotein translocase subunit SecY
MEGFISKLNQIFRDKSLRDKLLFILFALVLFRMLASIPIPGIDTFRLEALLSQNQFLGLLNIFSGGGLSALSIVMLGVGPYITASIAMQLMTTLSPKLKALYHEEGEAGRKKFTQYSRLLTLPLAIFQSFAFILFLQAQGVIDPLSSFELLTNISIITAGSILLMWVGELITEYGIGNGVSLIIFAGIVAGLPVTLSQLLFTFQIDQLPLYIAFVAAAVLITLGVVVVNESERPIPITYAKQVRGMKVYGGVSTYLPLRVNQAGVMPIIFALSILLFPQMIFEFLSTVITNPTFLAISSTILGLLSAGWFYSIFYFVLVFLFTYFYTAITFDPESIATNLKKSGAFIPGVRPGRSTEKYIGNVLTRITLVGATFLGFIAVLPLIMQAVTGIAALAIGGTALLIAVSVVVDLVKKIDAQATMREY